MTYIWLWVMTLTSVQKHESKNLFDSPLAASIQYIVKILCFFVEMLKFFPKKFKEQYVVKENKKLFWNIHKHSVFNMESSKLINCLIYICWSRPWHMYSSSIRVPRLWPAEGNERSEWNAPGSHIHLENAKYLHTQTNYKFILPRRCICHTPKPSLDSHSTKLN
jgi:hypothetical protein